jgi:hypothetical protein
MAMATPSKSTTGISLHRNTKPSPNHAKASNNPIGSQNTAHLQQQTESADDEVGFIAEKMDQLCDVARRVDFALVQLLQLMERMFVQQTLYPSAPKPK